MSEIPLTGAVARLLDIIREEWWPDRGFTTDDRPSNRVLAALVLAYPDDIHTRQKCSCGESDGCDECMDESEVSGLLKKCRETLGIEDGVGP